VSKIPTLPKADPDELVEAAAEITKAMAAVATKETNALTHAVAAGEQIVRVKRYLEEHETCLQTWEQWFRSNVRGYSLRTANNYECVYRQVELDRTVCYPNIRAALQVWRRAHPRTRFTPPKSSPAKTRQASRELLSQVPKVDLPPEHRRGGSPGGTLHPATDPRTTPRTGRRGTRPHHRDEAAPPTPCLQAVPPLHRHLHTLKNLVLSLTTFSFTPQEVQRVRCGPDQRGPAAAETLPGEPDHLGGSPQ
jgi:hypothetical protein